MAETDTSPAALRALAERRTSTQDPRAWIEGERQWVEDVRAALAALAAEKEACRLVAPTAEQREAIENEASRMFREWSMRGARGQVVRAQDNLSYWVVDATIKVLAAEKEVRAPAPAQGPLTEVGETSRGYKLYRAPNPVGGNTYWSDEIGGGVVVWDTCLVGEETLRLALSVETGAPAPDGWIPWEGGDPPVADLTRVDVRFRNGVEDPCYPAIFYHWTHDNSPDDIIAYRIAKES